MVRDLLIRSATAGDTDRILDLVKLSLGEGGNPRLTDYWTWKHNDNPFGESPCLLAEAGGGLVGLRVFMRWTWRAGADTVRAVRAVDTATHPGWRGRKIFSRLTLALVAQMKAEGVAFVFNTPNAQSRPGYLKMGWISVGRTSLWVRPLRPLTVVSSLLSSGSSESTVENAVRPSEVGAPVCNLLEEPWLPRFLATLPDSADRFSTPRSVEYFRWRYVAIPGLEYRAAWHVEGGNGAAVIFRLKQRRGLRELRLCEVLVGNSRESIRRGREIVCSLARGVTAHLATAMAVTDSPEQRVLIRSGFVLAPRLGPLVTVRLLNDVGNGLNPRRRTDWRLSIGDLELF